MSDDELSRSLVKKILILEHKIKQLEADRDRIDYLEDGMTSNKFAFSLKTILIDIHKLYTEGMTVREAIDKHKEKQ